MLHEVLASLLGIPGGIFVESPDYDGDFTSPLVPVSNNLPFVSPSELALAKRLLRLGNYYRTLEDFVQQFSVPQKSIYIAAFATGLDNALDIYRQAVCALESESLSSRDVGLSHFCYRLHSYQLILPAFMEIAHKVQINRPKNAHCNSNGSGSIVNKAFHGCRILDAIHSSAPLGLSIPLAIIRKIFNRTLRVFYRQLSSWLLYGVLHDPYKEFFIDKFVIPISDDSENNTEFYIVEDRVPELISCIYAQYVLSIGQVIHSGMLSRTKASFLSDLEANFSSRFSDLIKSMEASDEDSPDIDSGSLFDIMSLQKLVSDMYSFVSARMWISLVLEQHLIEFIRMVKDIMLLGRGELFIYFFDRLCDVTIHSHGISSQGNCGLLDRPAPSTIEEAKGLEYEITAAFMAAARSVGLDDELLRSRFRFKLGLSSQTPARTTSSGSSDPTIWDSLELHVLVPAAFRSVFSKQICLGYSRLFSHLGNIRRTQLILQNYWAEQTSLWRQTYTVGQFNSTTGPSVQSSPYRLFADNRLLMRTSMAFIVENLQYYLMVDVIESQFCQFIDRIKSDRQGELIRTAQEAFVASLQAQALLFHPTVNSLILRILSTCRQYVGALTSRSARLQRQQSQSTVRGQEEEQRLLREFHRLSASLFHCLSRSQSSGAKVSVTGGGPEAGRPVADLSQLLLRLDYNNFFSRTQGAWETESSSTSTDTYAL